MVLPIVYADEERSACGQCARGPAQSGRCGTAETGKAIGQAARKGAGEASGGPLIQVESVLVCPVVVGELSDPHFDHVSPAEGCT